MSAAENRLLVERKIALVRENLLRLRELSRLGRGVFLSDFTKSDSAQHRLQTTIQALIDLAAMAAGRAGISVPGHATDLVDALHRAGAFTSDRRDTYVRMFRFRNVLVHLYDRVDLERVWQVLATELPDIESFLADLERALEG